MPEGVKVSDASFPRHSIPVLMTGPETVGKKVVVHLCEAPLPGSTNRCECRNPGCHIARTRKMANHKGSLWMLSKENDGGILERSTVVALIIHKLDNAVSAS